MARSTASPANRPTSPIIRNCIIRDNNTENGNYPQINLGIGGTTPIIIQGNRVLGRYTADIERAKMLPMFVDKASFARATGLNNIGQAYAVIFNRQGEVLARVEGPFNAEKAQLLRETLAAPK